MNRKVGNSQAGSVVELQAQAAFFKNHADVLRKLEFLYAVFKGLNIFFADFFITEIIFKIILVKQNILQTPIGGVVFGFFFVQLPERVVDVGFNVFRIADVCNERRAPVADKIFGLILNFNGCRSGANAFYYAVGIFLVLSTVIKVIAEKVFVVKNKFVSQRYYCVGNALTADFL